jgi:hypothetical protein
MVSPSWIEVLLRYRAAITPPNYVPPKILITPEVEPVFLQVSLVFTILYDNMKKC